MARTLEIAVAMALGVTVVPFALRWLLPYTGPFLIALMLAALVDAPVNKLEAHGLPRGWAVALCLTMSALIISGATTLVVVRLLTDVNQLLVDMPSLVLIVQDKLLLWLSWLETAAAGLPYPLAESVRTIGPEIAVLVNSWLIGLVSAATEVPGLLTDFTVALLATFFLARDGRKLAASALENMPPSWRSRVGRINREIFAGVVGFVRVQALLMVISAFLSILAFLLFQIPYPWLFGALAGVLDLVPFLGPSGIFLPAIIYKWVGDAPAGALGLCAAWLMTLAIRQACEPWLVRTQAGLHPVITLVAIYAGIQAYGLVGLLVGPLLALALRAVWLGMIRPAWFSHTR